MPKTVTQECISRPSHNLQGMDGKSSSSNLTSQGSAGLLALAELHRRNSAQNLLNKASANNLLAAAANAGGAGLSGSAMSQIARNASAARFASLTAAGNSMNNLLMKAGFSHEQLSQLAREGASSASLKNMMERQSSFDALMSLDFQSLQSIDNLANLIQTGAQGNNSESDMKNWSADLAAVAGSGSNNNLSSLASARRLASAGHMESLLRSLSSGNVNKADGTSNGGSNANFNSVLQSMQNNTAENSASGLFGQGTFGFTYLTDCVSLCIIQQHLTSHFNLRYFHALQQVPCLWQACFETIRQQAFRHFVCKTD